MPPYGNSYMPLHSITDHPVWWKIKVFAGELIEPVLFFNGLKILVLTFPRTIISFAGTYRNLLKIQKWEGVGQRKDW